MMMSIKKVFLTPNKLVFGRNLDVVAPNHELEVEKDLSKRAKYINQLIEHWWKRWQTDYLTELREYNRSKTVKLDLIPKVGDVVLIADDKLKRSQWRIGQIQKLTTSKDGNIRTAEIITKDKKTLMRRPISKLYPIAINEEPVDTDKTANTVDDSNIELEKYSLQVKFIDEKNITCVENRGGSVR